MKVLIAGAGIGGLTAALSLQRAGIEVLVHEAAAEILPLGVGINVLPHASREFIELGLEKEVDEFAIRTTAMNYYTADGNLVISQPCGLHAGYKWPQWSLHRGDLHMMLLRVFKKRAGGNKVVTDAALIDFEDAKGGGVTARFKHERVGGYSTVECDVLVGADGLHSATRKYLYPNEGKPIYAGFVVYRAAVEAAQYLDGKTMVIIGDKRLRLVAYPVSSALQRRGDGSSQINWIGVLPMAENEAPTENWENLSEQEKLKPRYANWRFDWIDIPELMAATQDIYEFPVYDRDPLDQWTFGRVTMLGDAAHPLIPVSSSGAVQAIIDGRALAYALATHDDPSEGLQAYEADRLETANATVRASRANGPDEVLEIVKERCPEGTANIHDYVSHEELQAVIDDFKEKTGFGIDTLNSRRSYQIDARSSQ
jgi:2-polyprenyl-6-methoxyphenol hydroxylase-like FAD-dependent oxidoreductase